MTTTTKQINGVTYQVTTIAGKEVFFRIMPSGAKWACIIMDSELNKISISYAYTDTQASTYINTLMAEMEVKKYFGL